jgi:CheY-like chemotaxis protein
MKSNYGNPTTANKKRLILVVEDNELNRDILCSLLEDDYDTIEAENGLEGLELLREYNRELSMVLLDAYMPVCDGFEFLRRRREDELLERVPVIVTTASNTMEDEIRALQDLTIEMITDEAQRERAKMQVRAEESPSFLREGLFSQLQEQQGELLSLFSLQQGKQKVCC